MSRRLSGIQVGDWIDAGGRHRPSATAYVDAEERTRSFDETRRRVHQLALALVERGVAANDRLAILAIDSAEFMETLFAAAKIGATVVPLNYRLQESELELLLSRCDPTYFFVSERYEQTALDVVTRLPEPCQVISYDGAAAESFEALIGDGRDLFPRRLIADDEVLCISFTSGTTGQPKGVLQSHGMFKAMATTSVLEYRVLRDEFRYSAAPMFHVAGMGLVVNNVLRGAASLILPQFEPGSMIAWLRKGVTGVFVVPTMISSMLQHPTIGDGGFPELRTIFYGAAPMSPTLLRQAVAAFGEHVDFYNGFGAGTEAGGQTVLTPEDHRRALAGETHLLESIGRPIWSIDVRIVDENMHDVPRGEVGEIASRSDTVMNGYLDQPERTKQAVVDGWFLGGDLAWQDEQGYFYLAGRKNDMIIRGGENVYPIEIETVLAELDDVLECAVIGTPDDHWGEVVTAYVVTAPSSDLDADALATHCRSRLAGYKVPTTFKLLDTELPKNASGKILKRELRTWT